MKTANEIFLDIISNPKFKSSCKTDVYNFPRPYYKNIKDVKAIVLGADPSNPQKKTFEYVFGLERGVKSPYFNKILDNLAALNLNLDNIYVQNLCPNYFKDVTDENEMFNIIADKFWLPKLRYELDSLFDQKVPVFITAWKVLEVISLEANKYAKRKKDIYTEAKVFLPNKLNRPAFALFRGGVNFYNLRNEAFKLYVSTIKKHL